MFLDDRTISFVFAVSQGITALVMLFFWYRSGKLVPALKYWTGNLCMQTLAQAFQIPIIPIAIVPASILIPLPITLGAVWFLFGLAQFTKVSVPKRPFYILTAAIVAGSFLLALSQIEGTLYLLLNAVTILAVTLFYFGVLARAAHRRDRFRSLYITLIILYVLYDAANLLTSLPLFMEGTAVPLGSAQPLRHFFSVLFLTGVNYCIFLLVNERLLSVLEDEAKEKEELLAKMRTLAERDGLTGLLNRMAAEHRFERSFEKNVSGDSLLAVMIDVDSFKNVNDRYGHDAGDKVLETLAEIFRTAIRPDDLVGRWGGDEFFLLCTEMNEETAHRLTCRIKNAVSEYPWGKLGLPQVSVSCGYTLFRTSDDKTSVLRETDGNLYEAKHLGGNRAVGSCALPPSLL